MTSPGRSSGSAGAAPDPYVDPDTGVLRNRLGISDPDELEVAEADFSAVRLAGLQQRTLPGDYDLAHLQRFHERIFGDVYPWAGELRTVRSAKAGVFCLPQHLESFATEVFGRLASVDHLRGLDRETFIDRLTELLADLNALHPFRERVFYLLSSRFKTGSADPDGCCAATRSSSTASPRSSPPRRFTCAPRSRPLAHRRGAAALVAVDDPRRHGVLPGRRDSRSSLSAGRTWRGRPGPERERQARLTWVQPVQPRSAMSS